MAADAFRFDIGTPSTDTVIPILRVKK
ncbi:hypothetical protein [Pasteurella multocida]